MSHAFDEELVNKSEATSKRGWLTYVSGLLLASFKAATDKVILRSDVLSHLAQLPDGVDKTALPDVLLDQCEKAMKFKVVV